MCEEGDKPKRTKGSVPWAERKEAVGFHGRKALTAQGMDCTDKLSGPGRYTLSCRSRAATFQFPTAFPPWTTTACECNATVGQMCQGTPYRQSPISNSLLRAVSTTRCS